MGDIKDMKGILTKYNLTLQNCVKKISDNNKLNQTVVNEIQDKIEAIKKRVFTARNNVEEIGKQQTAFYNAMEQEKGKILNEQKKHMADSADEQERLQNQLKESQNQSATKIQELEARQEKKIQDLKDQAGLDAKEAIRIQKEKDDHELQIQVDELSNKMEAANRVAAEKAETAKKEAVEAKKLADNEKLAQEQKFQELEQQRQAIFEKDTACEEQLEKLKANVTDMKGEIEKMKGDIETLNTRNSEDKKAAAEESQRAIEQLNAEHGIEMKTQIEKAGKEKEKYMGEAAETQKTAIAEALREAEASHKRLADEKLQATKAAQGNLEDQLEQCKQSKKAYEKEVEDHLAKYEVLEQQFANSKGIAMGELQKLVERLGDDDIKSLEATIDGILKSKTGGPGKGLKRQGSTQQREAVIAELDADKHQFEKQMSRLDDPDDEQAIQKRIQELKEEEDMRMKKHDEDEARFKKIAEGKPPGNPKEAWGESHALAIDQTWVAKQMGLLPRIKENIQHSVKAKEAFNKMLLEGIQMYIDKIGSYKDFADLKHRIVDPKLHGMTNDDGFAELYKNKMDSIPESKDWSQNERHLYYRILVSMVTTYPGAYKNIIEEIIKKNGFEKVFEQLITAFHLLYSPGKIVELYKSGKDMKDSDMKRNGKLAIKLWSGNYDKHNTWEKVPVGDLKKNAGTNGDRLNGNDAQIEMKHRYYHKHDAVAKVASTKVIAGKAKKKLQRKMSGEAFAGGFRHGKRSQKKNKRTLKSKLTAKKYSLKVGKKKKGKKGNKSQKRRKSIKIRI